METSALKVVLHLPDGIDLVPRDETASVPLDRDGGLKQDVLNASAFFVQVLQTLLHGLFIGSDLHLDFFFLGLDLVEHLFVLFHFK